ncbi:MAG: TetR/AcrR family transcriptional regulator [Chitinophagaceae bacterium]|nr:TetR/AcrR family transcriptional regulator [Chitinophagaceae bacterium]
MLSTKAKIIEESERLFFEQGIAGIRLQNIADAAGISVGNLAYHFKNKEAIVETVYENLFSELTNILSQYMVFPDLSGFDKQFSALYKFYDAKGFTFNNWWHIERSFPDIQKEWLSLNNKVLLQLKKRIDYNLNNGIFKPEPYKGAYEALCQNLLLSINTWIPHQLLRRKPSTEYLYKKALWAVLYPAFTQKGEELFAVNIAPALHLDL